MHGKILTASCLFRGKNLSALEVESTIAKFKNKKESSFVEWIPDNMMNSICKVPAAASPGDISGTFLCNSTLINQSFDHLLQNFDKMLRAKAYVHCIKVKECVQMSLRRLLTISEISCLNINSIKMLQQGTMQMTEWSGTKLSSKRLLMDPCSLIPLKHSQIWLPAYDQL